MESEMNTEAALNIIAEMRREYREKQDKLIDACNLLRDFPSVLFYAQGELARMGQRNEALAILVSLCAPIKESAPPK